MLVSHSLEEAAAVLRRGGAVIYPTDTVFGLGVNALNELAIRLLFRIKNRAAAKPVPLSVASLEQAKTLAWINQKQARILRGIWPGAVTAVLRKKNIVPSLVTAGRDTVALRLHNSRISQALSAEFPITGTSANLSGEEPAKTVDEALVAFYRRHPQPDLILDIPMEIKSQPSTIIDLTDPEQPRILRVGMATKEQLMEILKL